LEAGGIVLIFLDLNCGVDTCAKKPGAFCQYLALKKLGLNPHCDLFDLPVRDENGDVKGWLLRLDECKKAEIFVREKEEV
jgi:hypothetical protein